MKTFMLQDEASSWPVVLKVGGKKRAKKLTVRGKGRQKQRGKNAQPLIDHW